MRIHHLTGFEQLETILRTRRLVAASPSPLSSDYGVDFFDERTNLQHQDVQGRGALLICDWVGPVRKVGADCVPPFEPNHLLDMNPWRLLVPCGSDPALLRLVDFKLSDEMLDQAFSPSLTGWLGPIDRYRLRRAERTRTGYRARLQRCLDSGPRGLAIVPYADAAITT